MASLDGFFFISSTQKLVNHRGPLNPLKWSKWLIQRPAASGQTPSEAHGHWPWFLWSKSHPYLSGTSTSNRSPLSTHYFSIILSFHVTLDINLASQTVSTVLTAVCVFYVSRAALCVSAVRRTRRRSTKPRVSSTWRALATFGWWANARCRVKPWARRQTVCSYPPPPRGWKIT